jgi:subtilisin family serine protease
VRIAATLTLFATCAIATAIVQPCDAGAVRRAYFRAATKEARQRLAPFVARELRNGIVCATVPPAMIQTFSADPGLTFIGYEALFHPGLVVNDEPPAEIRPQAAAGPGRPCPFPAFTQRVGWGIKAMYEDPNLVQPSGGAGVRVGVIDTGVAPHLDLVRRLVKCMDLTPSDSLPACADTMNHGTMVASVIAADGGADGAGMWGMAPEASIYSYRVCEPNHECWGAYVADGIYAAIADGVNIINMSLEGPGNDEAVRAAIDEAVAHNILIVVSAGNSPPYSYVGYPASYPEVVSVGAIMENRAPWPFSASGLNNGDYLRDANEIEVAAPGAAVLVARNDQCWGLPSGTSFSAPMVAGLAAKLWNGSAAETRERIRHRARFHDLYLAGDDTLTGAGLPTNSPAYDGLLVINAAAGTGGTISPSRAVPLSPGATQAFTIASDNCHSIADVKVDGVSLGPRTSYTFSGVTANHVIVATFTSGPFTITASAGPGGTIDRAGVTQVTCGGSITYTIRAAPNCTDIRDVMVDGVSQGPIDHYTFTDVTSDHTIEAIFTPPALFTITASAGPGGVINPAGATTVTCGGSRSYTTFPATACTRLVDLKVDGLSVGPMYSYVFLDVRSDHTIEATFGPSTVSYTISASADAGGLISPEGLTHVACGGSLAFDIAPRDGCHDVDRLIVDGVPRAPSRTYTFTNVTSNHTLLATFSFAGSYAITASAGPGGVISPGGTALVSCGQDRTYAITPIGACRAIQDVKVDGVSRGPLPNYTFAGVMTNHTIRATFMNAGPFTITASAGPGGVISPAGASTVPCASSSSYTITPADECHRIENVKVDGVSKGAVAIITLDNVIADHVIEASFALRAFTITASAGPGGTIAGGDPAVLCGDSRTYAIAPADHCHAIEEVKVDGASKGAISSYTFSNVTGDHIIQATFSTLGPFAIDAMAGPGVSITPAGVASVPCGASRSYEIAPADACRLILDVQVDGISVGAVTQYTFSDVHARHRIVATSAPSSLALAENHAGASWGGQNDGAIDLTVTGGIPPYAFAWSNGATSEDLSGLAAGTYEVRVTDSQGCTNTLSATIVNVGPAELTLSPPAPNPTSGSLRLRYGIPAEAAVRLSVLDLQGREIAVLARGTMPPGWSWASWNGETERGRAPGGVYFIRLHAGARQLVQRFALVR